MSSRNTVDHRHRLAFVTSVYPHAQEYGAQQRVLNILRLLNGFGEVSIVLLVDGAVDADSLRKTRAEFGDVTVMPLYHTPLTSLRQRLRFELDSRLVNTSLFSIAPEDQQRLHAILAQCDLVWIHTLRTANECGVYKWPRSILDLDDIPSQLSATNATVQEGMLDRLAARRMSFVWRRREHHIRERFARVVVCSEVDRRYIGGGPQVSVIPNGFPEPATRPARLPAQPSRIGFIGALWGRPNRDGVNWFVNEVWPLVKRETPGARLRLMGEPAGYNFADAGPDIDQLGHVAEPNDEIGTWYAMIVPIRIGGGTRVKIAQAFARNCPVISTTLGAYGYPVTSGKELLIADDAQTFARACLRLIDDPHLGAAIADNAWNRFQNSLTWRAIGSALQEVVDGFLAENEHLAYHESEQGGLSEPDSPHVGGKAPFG